MSSKRHVYMESEKGKRVVNIFGDFASVQALYWNNATAGPHRTLWPKRCEGISKTIFISILCKMIIKVK